jgi:hypothetical protein
MFFVRTEEYRIRESWKNRNAQSGSHGRLRNKGSYLVLVKARSAIVTLNRPGYLSKVNCKEIFAKIGVLEYLFLCNRSRHRQAVRSLQ